MIWPPSAALVLLAAASAGTPLSLSQATAQARLHHPEVRRAEAAYAQALSRRVGAGQLLPHSPEVSVAAGRRHDSSGSRPPSTGPEWTVQLGQTLEVAGQRGARVREVRWAVAVAERMAEEARLAAAADAAVAYVAAQAAEGAIGVAQDRQQLAERVLAMVQDKELAGATGSLERMLAEVELGMAQAQLLRAQGEAIGAREALWRATGLDAGTDATLAPLAPPRAVGEALAVHADGERAPLETLVARALLQRPQAQALLAAHEALGATVARLGREAVPSPTLLLEAQHQQPGQQYFGAGLQLPIPVLQRLQGPRAEAHAQRQRAAVERALFAQQLRHDLAAARARVHAEGRVFAAVDGRQLPAARSHADMTVAAWQAGKLELTPVVQSLRDLAQAQQHHTDATAMLWRAHIELSRLLGDLP